MPARRIVLIEQYHVSVFVADNLQSTIIKSIRRSLGRPQLRKEILQKIRQVFERDVMLRHSRLKISV